MLWRDGGPLVMVLGVVGRWDLGDEVCSDAHRDDAGFGEEEGREGGLLLGGF